MNMTSKTIGTRGLGLMSIKERVSCMGGCLEIETNPGQGSCFTLKIPYHLVNAEFLSSLDHPTNDGDSGAQIDFHTVGEAAKRVMFADDHHVMREGVIELISSQPGIQVIGEADNGREAIEKARKLRPDVIVMDVSMPVMDGIEATRCIKSEMPHIRVVGLSMHEDEPILSKFLESGGEAFINKTASSAELSKAIYGTSKEKEFLG